MSIIFKSQENIVSGRYEIVELIGEGGVGAVYRAYDKHREHPVAIKVLRNELLRDSKQVAVFKCEALLAAQLNHPNIVTVYETLTDQSRGQDLHLLVMEYLPGGSLSQRIRKDTSFAQSIIWIKQLLHATAYAHDKGVIHQDIKSANVFLNCYEQIKLGDFGLARLVDSEMDTQSGEVSLTKSGLNEKSGTPAYMSPELCFGEVQDERSDIYSLGILFFELLTGKLPFEAQGVIELARQHISKPVPSMMRYNKFLPPSLDKIVKRMMQKEKDSRYQSARHVLRDIEEMETELSEERGRGK